jgi:hypothetical protein
LVVELYRRELDVEHARDPLLLLNTSKVDPVMAARAIDEPDLVIWYEVINPIRAVTVDGGPAADDYSKHHVHRAGRASDGGACGQDGRGSAGVPARCH